MRVAKSETRDFVEKDRVRLRLGETSEWHMTNATFFTAFVVIAGVLTVLAIVLR
jgi:hypothetical protein